MRVEVVVKSGRKTTSRVIERETGQNEWKPVPAPAAAEETITGTAAPAAAEEKPLTGMAAVRANATGTVCRQRFGGLAGTTRRTGLRRIKH